MMSRSVALLLLAAPSAVWAEAPANMHLNPLETLLAIADVPETKDPPHYDCSMTDALTGTTLWTPDWKAWCCENENLGCDPALTLPQLMKKKLQERRDAKELQKQKDQLEDRFKAVLGKFGDTILKSHETAVEEALAAGDESEPKKAGPKKAEPEEEPKWKLIMGGPKKAEPEEEPKWKLIMGDPKKAGPKKAGPAKAEEKFSMGPVQAEPARADAAGSWALGSGRWALGAFVLGSAAVGFSALLGIALRRTRTSQRFRHVATEGLGDSLEEGAVVE